MGASHIGARVDAAARDRDDVIDRRRQRIWPDPFAIDSIAADTTTPAVSLEDRPASEALAVALADARAAAALRLSCAIRPRARGGTSPPNFAHGRECAVARAVASTVGRLRPICSAAVFARAALTASQLPVRDTAEALLREVRLEFNAAFFALPSWKARRSAAARRAVASLLSWSSELPPTPLTRVLVQARMRGVMGPAAARTAVLRYGASSWLRWTSAAAALRADEARRHEDNIIRTAGPVTFLLAFPNPPSCVAVFRLWHGWHSGWRFERSYIKASSPRCGMM
jgi:hypothetical protein